MAIMINGMLKGKLGDQVYTIRNGKNYVRAVRKITVTSEARLAGQQLFAKAGKLCKSLKPLIAAAVSNAEPHLLYVRLMSAILHWVRAVNDGTLREGSSRHFFNVCHFNKSFAVKDCWHVPLEFSHASEGLLQLKIPAFIPVASIKAPAHTAAVELKIVCAGCMAEDGAATGSFSTIVKFDYNDKEVPAQIIELQMPTPAGSLILLAASIDYKLYGANGMSVNKNIRYMPSGIIDAVYVG